MKILALETSTLMGSAALVVDGKVIAEKSSGQQRSHSEVLNHFIQEILKEGHLTLEDIDVFAVGQGPGSFTGIRIAGNIAKTLAYSYQKPMVAIDTLTILAFAAAQSMKKNAVPSAITSLPIFSIINAYKNMVYYGLFKNSEAGLEFIAGPGVIPVRHLEQILKQKCLVVGDGFTTFSGHFREPVSSLMLRHPGTSDEPTASTLGLLATTQVQNGLTLDWNSFLPLYIRASEAEEKKQGIFITSL